EDLRAILHRPAASGIWTKLRSWTVHFQADRGSAQRHAQGHQPHGRRQYRGSAVHRDAAGPLMGPSIHASCVLIGAKAVLIRGESGAGKSVLALQLMTAVQRGGLAFARLVADDRVLLEATHGRLLARP